MPTHPPPCCASAEARHRGDLPHVSQFDFDFYQCSQCALYWVLAWREGRSGWEAATAHDAEQIQVLEGTELRVFMKTWAKSFS